MCRVLGQHRSTQRRIPAGRDDEDQLTADIVELARQYGRYGYRKVAELLRSQAGWVVNDKRVERIWRREGLKVPARQPKRSRLWLNDGSCIRLRAERPNRTTRRGLIKGIAVAPPAFPLPAALPLFATALAGMGLLGWRRKRKASV